MAQRGSYAKGVAKREEILERALDVIATEGYDGASVKRIAEAPPLGSLIGMPWKGPGRYTRALCFANR